MNTHEEHNNKGLTNEKIKELKAASHGIDPLVWIGKAGLTDTVINEAKKQLKAKGLIKVKFLKNALELMPKKELAKAIAEKTDSIAVHQVGFIVVLYKKRTDADKSLGSIKKR